MKPSSLVLLGALLAVSAAGYLALQGAGEEDDASPAQAKEGKSHGEKAVAAVDGKALAALRYELAALRAEVADLKRQMAAQSSVRPAQAVPAQAARQPGVDPLAQAEEDRQRREQMQTLEAAFRGESSDPLWSGQAGAVVQAAFARNKALQAALRSVECRSRTCRVEVAADGGGSALAKLIPVLALQVGKDLPSMTVSEAEDPPGVGTTILYFSKEPDQPSEGG